VRVLREELILRIIDKCSEFLSSDQAKKLKNTLDIEFYDYEVSAACHALVPANKSLDVLNLYLACKKQEGLSATTLKSYKRVIGKFLYMIQKDVENITQMDCRAYLAKYANTGVKNTSSNTLTTILRAFFGWLSDNDYIGKSPMRQIKSAKTNKYVRKALTFEEFEKLRDSCETVREKALVEVFYSTGCRLDEIYKLNKSDIDWKTESMFVIGKGSKERQVFLTAGAMIKLKNYLKSRHDNCEALFVGERSPHERLGHRAIQRVFNQLGKRAEISKKVYPHLLRHTMATHSLKRGASMTEVQRLLGHTSPGTTQIYAQMDNEALQQAHRKHVS
jgi:integrase/recombinase XerD